MQASVTIHHARHVREALDPLVHLDVDRASLAARATCRGPAMVSSRGDLAIYGVSLNSRLKRDGQDHARKGNGAVAAAAAADADVDVVEECRVLPAALDAKGLAGIS